MWLQWWVKAILTYCLQFTCASQYIYSGAQRPQIHDTVNREIFVVKIFSDRLTSTKIKHTKTVRTINANAVRGRLSEIYLTRKFIARNIFDTKYSRFTVSKITMIFCTFKSYAGISSIPSFLTSLGFLHFQEKLSIATLIESQRSSRRCPYLS